MRVKIVSTGRHLPERIETAADLAPRLGVTEDWILSRTGVARRHVSSESMAEMGARAARQALGDGPPPDLFINASGVPHQVLPDSSVYIAEALGFAGIPCFSIHATCLSFPVALHNIGALIAAGAYRRVLIVSSELGTRGRNYDEPESASLFGDGAGAAVVEPTPEGEQSAILGFELSTFPKGAGFTEVRGGGTRLHPQDPRTTPADNLFHMDGPGIYRMAVRRVPPVFNRLFARTGVDRSRVKFVITHQASGPAVTVVEKFGFRPETIVRRVEEEGNCVAASIPMTLAWVHQAGSLERGDLVVLCGTGAGLSILTMLLRW
ncbi:MAG: ketoacyl-ACP synthase III [Polyangiaceae bacterium]|nr:ketoacyl-ACP synthase III [Polyangiaceae bacterium]